MSMEPIPNSTMQLAPELDIYRVQSERVRVLFRKSLIGMLSQGLVSIGVSLYYWLSVGSAAAAVLLLFFLAVIGGRAMIYMTYKKADDIDTSPEYWVSAATITMGASGVGWAGVNLFLFDVYLPSSGLVIGVISTAMLVSSILLLGSLRQVMLAFTLPMALSLLYQLLVSGEVAYWIAALLLVLILGTMFLHTLGGQETLIKSVQLDHDNTHLMGVVERSQKQIEKLNDELAGETANRNKVQKELRRAKIDAEAAVMSKDEFLATMSHEIRTPLNGILPILDIMRSTKLDDEQQEYLQTAFQSSKHLLSIIDNILDYSKIEAGKLELETVGINIRELMDSITRLMAGSARKKGLELKTVIESDVRLAMRGDPVRLKQVLTNLVSNAIKFTEQGSVLLTVSKRSEAREKTQLMFTVQDTGIGMDKKAADRLFRPFAQADASVTRNYGGTGLGLVISKRLIDLMGGEIGVKSQEGRGSAFWFTVQLKKSMGDIRSRQKEMRGSRLLMISNNEEKLKRCKVFFGSWGLQQDLTNDIREGVGKIKTATAKGPSLRYDVIILDETTLLSNAAKLCLKMRGDSRLDDTAVLLLTRSGELPKSVAHLQDVGACATDFTEGTLNQALENLFAGDSASSTAVSEEEIAQSSSYMSAPQDANEESLGGHLLLVEDNPVNMHVAQKILSVIGMKVDVAENGKEALRLLHEHQYKAVLMDCMMPVMDGYTATREWRKYEAQHGQARIPILAMTANAMAGDREKCLDSGMDDYMSKPLNRHLLEQMLRRWIKQGALANKPTVSIASAPAKTAPESATLAKAPITLDAGNLLDRQILDDLIDIMGDEFQDLVKIYLEDSPKSLARLVDAAEKDDPKLLVGPAHSLKSTSANLGAIQLSDLARDVEQDARLGKSNYANERVKQMHQIYNRVAAELEKIGGTG